MNTMFIVNTEYSIGNMKENVALSGIWNHAPPGNLSRVWQPLYRQDYHTGNAAVEKKGDLCRLEYMLFNIK